MSWPLFEEDEVSAVVEVLRSGKVNYWTGSQARAFEQEFAAYCGVAHGIALANGTVALELALRALGIGPGDDVVVPARSFFATASSVVACGARPVFADVDADSQNITATSLEAALTLETRAVIVVHLAGWPADMPSIEALCRPRGIKIVEDCAQAHGAELGERRVGSFGDLAAFSFCQDKIMTTGGEGGMIVTDDPDLHKLVSSLKDHGKDLDLGSRRSPTPGFRWLHTRFGSNARMTEMQAVIGRRQLTKLDAWLELRRRNAAQLRELLAGEPALRFPVPPPEANHAWYKFYCFLEPGELASGWTRDRLLVEMAARGAPGYSGSCPEIYLEAAFDGTSWRPARRFDVARSLGETSLMFLVDPCQTAETLALCAAALRDALAAARA